MSAPFRYGYDPVAQERATRSMSGGGGIPALELRTLCAPGFVRRGMGGKVGAYLTVLTESNARGMLRRKDAAAIRVSAAALVGG